jgi:hypothetical protein
MQHNCERLGEGWQERKGPVTQASAENLRLPDRLTTLCLSTRLGTSYGSGLWETPGLCKPWATSGRGSLPAASGGRACNSIEVAKQKLATPDSSENG